MKELAKSYDRGWPKPPISVFRMGCVFLAVCVMAMVFSGCISFSKPGKAIVLNMVAQSSGVLLAQELPSGVAEDILKYSEVILKKNSGDFTETTFHEWAGEVIEKLDVHPLLKVNFKELMKLVKIEVTLTGDQQEIVKLSREVIQNFIIGIKAGRR